ncbi:MAG: hypothetical protein CHACPFDD_04143 [Phycisphaerae bacterium]|nr:hypothetical protein [Phycisphaerae bacterium]
MRKFSQSSRAIRTVGLAPIAVACWLCGFAMAQSKAESLLTMSPAIGGTAQATTKPAARQETASSNMSDTATFLLGKERWHNDPEVLWPGFLSGLRGFEHFYEPIGNPLYFESPFNYTGVKLLYLHHDFPDGSQLGGGDVNVYAAQIRLALTERLGFIATKDGYSDLNARILPNDEGWNDFAIGAKYVFIADRENDFVLTGGMRWEWDNGDREILQGGTQELSPFVSLAKGFDRWHFLGNVTGRLPMDRHDANYILSWDLHADYEIAPEALPGLAPVVELHGLHYLSDGDVLPLSVGGLDYSNIGSNNVAGDSVVWAGMGLRWKLSPHMSVGSTWEFPLHNPDNDIMGNRVTVDLALTY